MDVLSDVMTVLRTGRPFAARFTRAAPWSNHYRGHPDGFGVQIVVRGDAVLTKPSGETIALGEGDALVLPRGSEHTIADSLDTPPGVRCTAEEERAGVVLRADDAEAAHASLCMAYELAPGRTHPLLASMPDFVHIKSDPQGRPELAGAIAMLNNELRSERSGGDALVPALLDAVLMYLLRAVHEHVMADQCPFSGWAAALADRSIGAALQAIHAEPGRQWTVAALGEVAGLSRSAFSRRFTELVGQPPQGYLTSWRLTLAAQLLTDTDAPLSSVARQVGYTSEFAFAAAFKREFSTPPGQFRKANPACETGPFSAAVSGAQPFRQVPVPA